LIKTRPSPVRTFEREFFRVRIPVEQRFKHQRPVGGERLLPFADGPARPEEPDGGLGAHACDSDAEVRDPAPTRRLTAASRFADCADPMARIGYQNWLHVLVSPGWRKEKSGWLSV